jgi:hypothetical protein
MLRPVLQTADRPGHHDTAGNALTGNALIGPPGGLSPEEQHPSTQSVHLIPPVIHGQAHPQKEAKAGLAKHQRNGKLKHLGRLGKLGHDAGKIKIDGNDCGAAGGAAGGVGGGAGGRFWQSRQQLPAEQRQRK